MATDPVQYAEILEQVAAVGGTTLELRRDWPGPRSPTPAATTGRSPIISPARRARSRFRTLARGLALQGNAPLRREPAPASGPLCAGEPGAGANLVAAQQLHGKELSYNNLLDLDSALAIVRSLDDPAAVVIKHNNPCGAATANDLAVATRAAMDGDPLERVRLGAGLQPPVDAATAEVLAEPGRFIEAIVAPDFEPAALEILTTRPKWKANVRLMKVGSLDAAPAAGNFGRSTAACSSRKPTSAPDPEAEWKVVTERQPRDEQWADLRFAWAIVRHVKSNAIVLAKDGMLLGTGAGQMSRVDSVEIAIKKAGERAAGSVLASDAFFPFADSIDRAAAAGVAAIIQPGGSRRDDEVIAACNDARFR